MIYDWMVMTWFFCLLFVLMVLSEYKHLQIRKLGIKTKRGTLYFFITGWTGFFIVAQFLSEGEFLNYEYLMMLLLLLSAYYLFRFGSTKGGEGNE